MVPVGSSKFSNLYVQCTKTKQKVGETWLYWMCGPYSLCEPKSGWCDVENKVCTPGLSSKKSAQVDFGLRWEESFVNVLKKVILCLFVWIIALTCVSKITTSKTMHLMITVYFKIIFIVLLVKYIKTYLIICLFKIMNR